ncbi:MAG TPA: PIN domain-containing protein [Anaerolineae bacterium]
MAVLVDTSFLFALTNENDKSHAACVTTAQTIKTRLIVPVTVLPEITYLLDVRLGHHAMRQFVKQMANPGWMLESLDESDLVRAGQMLEKYSDNRLDFVDATIVAIAERLNVKRILTLDQRHFRVIRPLHSPSFELLP